MRNNLEKSLKRYLKKKIKITLTLIVSFLISGNLIYGENVLDMQSPDPGTYDRIDREVNGGSNEGVLISDYNAGEFTITNGGNIIINQNSSTSYGINANDSLTTPTNIEIGGTLDIIVNNNYTGNNEKTMGIWKFGGYDHEGQSGKITLNNTNLEVNGTYNAYGLLAGDDFGNNSNGDGSIISNGNLNINVSTTNQISGTAGAENANRTFGIVTYDSGIIELNGEINNITVNGSGVGNDYRETAGLYTSAGGKINSSEKSNIIMNVSGNKVYGISTGYYDIITENKKGESEVNLKGNTIVNLFGKTSIGLAVYEKANANINNLQINFGKETQFNTGIQGADEVKIDINSLYIGANTDNDYITDPTKITAIVTKKEWGWNNPNISAGSISINKAGLGTVQVVGKIKANDNGTININLNNKNSYLYGNTVLRNYHNKVNGEINLDISNGAKWINVQDTYDNSSELTTLTLSNGSLIDITDTKYTDVEKYKWQDLIINKTFDGTNGTIHMDIDASTNINNSDRVYVNGIHSGVHYITLNNIGNNTDGAEGTILVSVKDEKGEFKANDSEGTLYWNTYDLEKKVEDVTDGYTVDWVLGKAERIDKPTTSVETILSTNSLNYHLWRGEIEKMLERIGDLRLEGAAQEGVWFRTHQNEVGRRKDGNFENEYSIYELGYDFLQEETSDYKRYLGASLSYGEGETTYLRGRGEMDMKTLTLYRTAFKERGDYLDLVFKITDINSDFKVQDTNNNKIQGKLDNVGLTFSTEYGYKKMIDDSNWYIEPQAQLVLGYLFGDNTRLNNGIEMEQDEITSVIGRAGFNVGKFVTNENNIYLKANILHEFAGDYSIDMKDSKTNEILRKSGDFGDTWYEVGIGVSKNINESLNIYADIERQFNDYREDSWQFNLGFRYRFGETKDLNPVVMFRDFSLKADSYFDFDKSELKPEGKAVIKKVSEELNKENVEGTLKIEGHTDWTGTREYNQKLSERRAKSVEDELKKNITTDKIQYNTKGYGEDKPIADNTTKEGRAKNRRVDIKFEGTEENNEKKE